jgi:hypothetical protein
LVLKPNNLFLTVVYNNYIYLPELKKNIKEMKKIYLIVSAVVLVFTTNNANGQAFEEGTKVAALGIGFPNFAKTLLKTGETSNSNSSSATTNYKATGFGPLHARFEYGLTDKFGIGLSINYNTYGATWNQSTNSYNSNTGLYTPGYYSYAIKGSSINFLIRGNRHWDVNDKVDIFSGFGLGYNSRTITYTSTDPNYNNNSIDVALFPVGFEWTVGMRYYFTENIGMYIEGGYAKDILQAGIVGKF